MGWRRFLSALLLPVALVLLSACIVSEQPFFAGVRAATPLPDAFVLVSGSKENPEVLRFDRQDDAYLAREGDKLATYRLFPLSVGSDAGRRLFVGMEVREGEPEASYGLVEIIGNSLSLHDFDAKELAAELGIPDDGSDYEAAFRNETDLVAVFEVAAARLVESGAEPDGEPMRIYDLGDPAERATAERLMEKARDGD